MRLPGATDAISRGASNLVSYSKAFIREKMVPNIKAIFLEVRCPEMKVC